MPDALPAALIDALRARLGDRLRPAEPLARHTSLRVGGPADVLAMPDTPDELGAVLRAAAETGVRVALLGGGSNVLIGDGGLRGLVVKLGRGFARIDWEADRESGRAGRRGLGASEERSARSARAPEGPPEETEADRESGRAGRRGLGASEERSAQSARAPDGPPEDIIVTAGAAVQLGRLVRAAVTRGLAGLEYAEGIPGTVGGALFMNAGAYGGEVAEAVEAVEGVDASGGTPRVLDCRALAFRYRRAELPRGFVVTGVRFRLRRDEPDRVRARMDDARTRRLASQPHGRASAGSIFKNPPGDHAGRLIEAAGLKGARAGRASISERHANVIVNEGGARAVDVKALMDLAQRVVWERSGIWLEPEVQLVGAW